MSSTLRVGINAIFLEPGMGGLETYIKELVPALLRTDTQLHLTVLCNALGYELLKAQSWASSVNLAAPFGTRHGLRSLYELGPLGIKAGREFDVLHSPAMTAPLKTRCANVVVVPDTTWISEPDLGKGQASTVRLWRAIVPLVARRADRVIAISSASANDVERYLGVPRERIDTIPLGYAERSRRTPTPETELRSRLHLGDGPIVLNVAMKKVHKNHMRLVQALPAVREVVPGAQLVLPGPPTPYEAQLRAEAARLQMADEVAFLGYVEDEDLEGLYAAASVFAFPSLNEGFGLPLLEAMGRGLPVITSNLSSMPEVVGDAAMLVDPKSVDSIAGAIVQVLTDEPLRKRLAAAGPQRTAKFTWEQCARQTVSSWRRALTER